MPRSGDWTGLVIKRPGCVARLESRGGSRRRVCSGSVVRGPCARPLDAIQGRTHLTGSSPHDGRTWHRLGQPLGDDGAGRVAEVRRPAPQHLLQHAPQAVPLAPPIEVPVAHRLLGTQHRERELAPVSRILDQVRDRRPPAADLPFDRVSAGEPAARAIDDIRPRIPRRRTAMRSCSASPSFRRRGPVGSRGDAQGRPASGEAGESRGAQALPTRPGHRGVAGSRSVRWAFHCESAVRPGNGIAATGSVTRAPRTLASAGPGLQVAARPSFLHREPDRLWPPRPALTSLPFARCDRPRGGSVRSA